MGLESWVQLSREVLPVLPGDQPFPTALGKVRLALGGNRRETTICAWRGEEHEFLLVLGCAMGRGWGSHGPRDELIPVNYLILLQGYDSEWRGKKGKTGGYWYMYSVHPRAPRAIWERYYETGILYLPVCMITSAFLHWWRRNVPSSVVQLISLMVLMEWWKMHEERQILDS